MKTENEIYERIAYIRGYIEGISINDNPDIAEIHAKRREIQVLRWALDLRDDEEE